MSSSRKTVLVAIGANFGIATAKIVGFLFTGSSAMLSEAIHSFVDCGNGGLLLFGQHRAARPANETHPFGYGKELYFWSLIVALLIFVLGGGISIAEGIAHVRHRKEAEDTLWAYSILGISILIETYSLLVSIKEFRASTPGQPFFKALQSSKDPGNFTIIFEEVAALLGLLTAIVGIFLSHTFGWLRADGIASIVIGLLLILVAILLIAKCKTLLVGEGAEAPALYAIRNIAETDPRIEHVGYPFTMYFGPGTVLLTMNVQFREGLSGEEIEAAIRHVEALIQADYPEIRNIYIEVGADLRPNNRNL